MNPLPPQAYGELVAAIVKAVPEINAWCSICKEEATAQLPNGKYFCLCDDGAVLGRPITLEDVLRALDANDFNTKGDVGMSSDGRVYRMFPEMQRIIWILGKPLSDQSDELKVFLHSLLASSQQSSDS